MTSTALRPSRLLPMAVLLSVLLLAAVACARSPIAGAPGAGSCLPSRLTVSPATVRVGGTVVLAAPRFACRTSYRPGTTYTVTLALVGRAAPEPLGSVPVAQDGSFRARLTVPPGTPPGESYLVVAGSAFDRCAERDGSCAGYVSPPLSVVGGRG